MQSSLNVRHDYGDRPFMPATHLTQMIEQGQAQLDGCLLSLSDGRRYGLQEAVRILGHVMQESTDPYGLTGVVLTLRQLLQRGFCVNANQVALGRVLYDIEQGYLAQPLADVRAV